MKIDITSSPYYPEFTAGYTVAHKREGRMYIVLVNGDHKACTSYARYVMAVNLGRRLNEDEQVDHIDEDKTNDSLDNLQLLSQADNIRKNKRKLFPRKHGTSSMYRSGCRCPECRAYMCCIRNKWHSRHKDAVNSRRRKSRASTT